MPALRNSGRPVRLVVGVAVLLLPLSAPGQQIGPPIPLVPPSAVPAAPGAQRGSIAAQPLKVPLVGWDGAVPAPAEALPGDFWQGTPRAVADLLLAHLPQTVSPTLQSLTRRLLLSQASAPEGPDAPGQKLALLRAAALLRYGETDAVRAVVIAMPAAERPAGLPLAVDADAVAGNLDRACTLVHDGIKQAPTIGWQTRLIACQALTGKTDEARLGLQVLAEEKASGGSALRLAIDATAGLAAPSELSRIADPEPLTLRLLVAAHFPLTRGLIDGLPPDRALAIARDADAPSGERLIAAARAGRFGALTADRLRALYAGLGKTAANDGSTPDDAHRFAAIAAAGTVVQRLSDIIGFADQLDKAPAAHPGQGTEGQFALAARLVLPLLQQIEPDPSLGSSAAAAARLLLAADDPAAARRWSALVAGAEGERLQTLLRLAGGERAPAATGAPAAQLPLLLALALALGEPVATADWLRLPANGWSTGAAAAVPAAGWLDLAAASRDRRVGETVLAVVLVAAPNGALSHDPSVLYAAVSGLMRIGLERDARRLAVEAALAAGL